ncbi:response regulator [Verrucomicrobium sp. BvORR106]|uniref:response regulator transcription factor n=1 Tax=Verrucomicrobium sp. BvORR106 TaxID=1403819 RepID=UPI002240F3B7|nr:response regulator [Verrucomicrobium sp. BvORR106]
MQAEPTMMESPPAHPAGMVCVVDDDGPVRRSIERLIRSWRMQATSFPSAATYLEWSRLTPHPEACCLVLDVCMPGFDGLELQQNLADKGMQIVFLTGHGDVPTCATAMKAGAVDFLTKPVEEDRLYTAIAAALERSNQARLSAQESIAAKNRLQSLTAREVEVMRCVIAGMLNKQIADVLGAAEKTVKIHRGRVMEKMGVYSVADLVRSAQAAGVRPMESPRLN